MRDEDRLEHRQFIYLLLPDDRAHAVVCSDKIAPDACLLESFRPVSEQFAVLSDKSFGDAVGIVGRNASQARFRNASTASVRSAQKPVSIQNELRRPGD